MSGSWFLRDRGREGERDGEIDTQRQREEWGGGRMGKRGQEGQTDRERQGETGRKGERGREEREGRSQTETEGGRERSVSSSAPTALESAQHILQRKKRRKVTSLSCV